MTVPDLETPLSSPGLDPGSCLSNDLSGLPDDDPGKRPRSHDQVLDDLHATAAALQPTVVEHRALVGDEDHVSLPPAVVLPNAADEDPAALSPRRYTVATPRFKAIYQARAVTPKKRTAADIDTLVLHTPEGWEAGTLSVLGGTRAGFDLFLAANGNLYKCNDWTKYVAWQAGDRAYNQRSIGLETDNFASTSGAWPAEYYRTVAHVCAWAIERLGIPVRHAKTYGEAGLIYHSTITPKTRSDPGTGFKMPLLLGYINEYLKGSTQPPTRAHAEKLWFATAAPALVPVCDAAVHACRSVGFKSAVVAKEVDDLRVASYKARVGKLGQFLCIVAGGETIARLHPEAQLHLRGRDGKWLPPERSDLWDATEEGGEPVRKKMRWRLAKLAEFERLDATKLLAAYEEALP
jgi:hypothetical protein